jgi:hypothetical protein
MSAIQKKIFERLVGLYKQAYGYVPSTVRDLKQLPKSGYDDSDVRSLVRTMVAALDHHRLEEEDVYDRR